MRFKTISREELVRLFGMAEALYEMDYGDLTHEQEQAVTTVAQNVLDLLWPGRQEEQGHVSR